MARRKQRVRQHIMEDESYEVIKRYIPNNWVIREFNRPDYGIDLVIELFEKIDEQISETLGEFIFVQVKSVEKLERKIEKIYPVDNVAKSKWKEDKSQYVEMEVVKYSFDTDSIYSIQSLGASVSVLLFLVDLESKEVYFICLNDYIDRIILPKSPNYGNQQTYTIKIPTLNKLSNLEISNTALHFYGKRAKLLASFSKFFYQRNELEYALIGTESNKKKQLNYIELVSYFISQIEKLDIWKSEEWAILPQTKIEIETLKNQVTRPDANFEEVVNLTSLMWHRLTNLGRIYEDLCREWFLPKFISSLSSYPKIPEVIKKKIKKRNKL
jgi:hypothetical protein